MPIPVSLTLNSTRAGEPGPSWRRTSSAISPFSQNLFALASRFCRILRSLSASPTIWPACVPPSTLKRFPGYSRASPPQKNRSLPTVLLCALTSDFTGGCPPPPSRSLCQRVNLELQFIKFLVILPFNFQLSLHLERGTHHAY